MGITGTVGPVNVGQFVLGHEGGLVGRIFFFGQSRKFDARLEVDWPNFASSRESIAQAMPE